MADDPIPAEPDAPGVVPPAELARRRQLAEEKLITAPPEDAPNDHGSGASTYFYVSRAEDDPHDIDFQVEQSDIPEDVLRLKSDIERTLSALRVLYAPTPTAPPGSKAKAQTLKFEAAFTKLLGLAQVGLGPTNAPAVAREALTSLHAEIVDRESGAIKNRYMVQLGAYALVFASIAIVLRLLILFWQPKDLLAFVAEYANVLMVFAGCMAGTWLSFGTRKIGLSFFDLIRLEDDQLEPWLRLIFTGLITHVLLLMVATGVLDISVGNFQARGFFGSAAIAFLFGAICGLSEKALPSALSQRASSILEGVGRG